MKELLRRVQSDEGDAVAQDLALTLFRTATLRSGYMLRDTHDFALSVERLLRQQLGVPQDDRDTEHDDIDAEHEDARDMEEEEEEEEVEDHDEL